MGATKKQASGPVRYILPKVESPNNTERPYSLEFRWAVRENLFPGAKVRVVSNGMQRHKPNSYIDSPECGRLALEGGEAGSRIELKEAAVVLPE